MSEITTVLVECAANDHVLSLHLEEDEGAIYLALYIGEFYAKQRSFLSRWWERLGIAATILRGREYSFEDVVLNSDATSELFRFLKTVTEAPDDLAP